MIDATALNDFRRCPELYRQRHARGLVPISWDDEAISAGQAWHKMLETWFSNPWSDVEAAIAALEAAWGPTRPAFSNKAEKRPLSLMKRLCEVYAEVWPREKDDFEVVAVERYRVSLFDEFDYCGILDLEFVRNDGRYIMDAKTTSMYLNDSYFDSWMLSTQLRGYAAMKLVEGQPVEGVYLDVVYIDARSKVKKALKEYFVRREYKFPQHQLDDWARDVERNIAEIERYKREVGVEERWEQRDINCFNFNRRCIMWDLCTKTKELADADEKVLYKVSPWKPEELR